MLKITVAGNMRPRNQHDGGLVKPAVGDDTMTLKSIGVSLRGNKVIKCSSATSVTSSGLNVTVMNPEDTSFDAAVKADTDLVLQDLEKDTKLFRQQPSRNLPQFQTEELTLSGVIGEGEFGEVCSVLAISDINKKFGSSSSSKKYSDDGNQPQSASDDPERIAAKKRVKKDILRLGSRPDAEDSLVRAVKPEDLRAFMAERCYRGDSPRYAIKRVAASLLESDFMASAIVDLAAEAKFLSHLDHSNIIKVRATVGTPGTMGFMIVLDRLVNIMDNKVKEWKQQQKSSCKRKVTFGLRFGGNSMERHDLATERLVAMFDIARALRYLRSNEVLFRDLKPENIGCDVRGDFKIFDFGLAKELKEKDLAEKPDSYNLTGLVGTRRWMAPEVCLCKNYGFSSDVFSFCMVFWHVMTLSLPFDGYDSKKHKKNVVLRGERPSLRKLKMSKMMRQAIICGWGDDCTARPTIAKLCELIQLEILIQQSETKKRGSYGNFKDRSKHLIDQSMDSRFGGY